MSEALPVDAVALRDEVRAKYRDVAVNPRGGFHFHTGRPLARRLGYDEDVIARMPETAVEAFAGVGNPFSQGALNSARTSRMLWSCFGRAAGMPTAPTPLRSSPFRGPWLPQTHSM
jgi:hypothetical protein